MDNTVLLSIEYNIQYLDVSKNQIDYICKIKIRYSYQHELANRIELGIPLNSH